MAIRRNNWLPMSWAHFRETPVKPSNPTSPVPDRRLMKPRLGGVSGFRKGHSDACLEMRA